MFKSLPLIEVDMNFSPVLCEEVEGKDGNKEYRVGGRFQHADLKNANGRVYPFAILQREVNRVQEDILKRRFVGEPDHPADGQTSLNRISHVITKLEMKDKEVYGEYETVDTEKGRTLKALLKANVGIGVSSRGSGHVINKGDVLEVADDYQLLAIDAVIDPSTPNAYPSLLSEQVITLIEINASTAENELVSNFYEVMKIKGFPGLKFDVSNVDVFINAYKDFIKQDLTVAQYNNLRGSLLAQPQDDKDHKLAQNILSMWNIGLGKAASDGMVPGLKKASNG